jgi:hypothetical protein
MKNADIENGTTGTSLLLSYDVENQTHRSAGEEWRPHRVMTDKSF